MILIDCHYCDRPHLASNSDVRSLTTVDGAVLGEVHCAIAGQCVIHDFTNNQTIDPAHQLASRALTEADAV